MHNNRVMKAVSVMLLTVLLLVGSAACGSAAPGENNNTASGDSRTEQPADAANPADNSTDSVPAGSTNDFLSNLQPQVLYDKNGINVTLDEFPEKSPLAYRVTTVNGSDAPIIVRLGPWNAGGVSIIQKLVNPDSKIANDTIAPGTTGTALVQFGTLSDYFEVLPYREHGLGSIGDFKTDVIILNDMMSETDRATDVLVTTARGPQTPDLAPVTKNLLIDEGGVKLYLVEARDNETSFAFTFFYENTLSEPLVIESAGMKWDGTEYDTKLYNTLLPGIQGFFSHSASGSQLADQGITDPQTVEISFVIKHSSGDYSEVARTEYTNLNLAQYPWLKE